MDFMGVLRQGECDLPLFPKSLGCNIPVESEKQPVLRMSFDEYYVEDEREMTRIVIFYPGITLDEKSLNGTHFVPHAKV
jgi:outer membrane receptor for ferrienterochelin and colicin